MLPIFLLLWQIIAKLANGGLLYLSITADFHYIDPVLNAVEKWLDNDNYELSRRITA